MNIENIVNEIFYLYENFGGSNYIGEDISKTNHSIQCAVLAEQDGQPTEMILGVFLHDIGHLIGESQNLECMVTDGINFGTQNHDIIGGEYLRKLGFPEKICSLVQGHVQAKRYLVWKYPEYHSQLSNASKNTLVHQGGPMSDSEAEDFEKSELCNIILKMRQWDDQGKDVNANCPPLQKYKRMCTEYLQDTVKM